MSQRSILDLQKGETGLITAIQGTGRVRQRLLDMGLLPKRLLHLKRVAPGGAPIWIQIGTSQLALRREEAAMVFLTDATAEAETS